MKQIEKNIQVYEKLYVLQEQYNQHTNITRINSKEDYYNKHILDSISLIDIVPQNVKLIDVGSGGGYPGIPLAIERPDIQVTLNDSSQKKTNYITLACTSLGLTNTTVVKARAEDLGQDQNYRETFDVGTARAVASVSVLLELISPLIKVGGSIYLMKSKNYELELAESKMAQSLLHTKFSALEKYTIDNVDRVILIFNKEQSTPRRYPRQAGTPENKPL